MSTGFEPATPPNVRPVKKKVAGKATPQPGPRQRVISEIIGDDDILPTPEEAIAELNKAVRSWDRITGLYDLLCDLQEGIPAGELIFPPLQIPQQGGASTIVIDPAQWTQADQLKLIELFLRNTVSGYHKQLGALADAAVTGVASFSAD